MSAFARGFVSILSLGVAIYAFGGYAYLPMGALVHPDMRASFQAHAVAVYVHVFGAAFALLLGPVQFSARLRARRPAVHRLCGRLYLLFGVALGGGAGLYLSAHAHGGWLARSGFGLLALAWLTTGVWAWMAARARRFDAHRRWMMRNYALSFAAVTLRIYVGAGLATGADFDAIYPWIAWACWVPNLVLVQLWIRRPA